MIGFFDSGFGGLTVMHHAQQYLPREQFVYFSDGKHAPYGTKSKEEVCALLLDALDFLAQQKPKAIVVACNTATGVGIEAARARYPFPVIGMEPAVKPALAATTRRVLVLATVLTFQLEKFQRLVARVDGGQRVDYLPAQQLVSMAEQFQFDDAVVLPYLHEIFAPLVWEHYGALVLGCTHFPFFYRQLRQVVPPHVQILDGHEGTVRQLKKKLGRHLARKPLPPRFYFSKTPVALEYVQKWLEHYRCQRINDFQFSE